MCEDTGGAPNLNNESMTNSFVEKTIFGHDKQTKDSEKEETESVVAEETLDDAAQERQIYINEEKKEVPKTNEKSDQCFNERTENVDNISPTLPEKKHEENNNFEVECDLKNDGKLVNKDSSIKEDTDAMRTQLKSGKLDATFFEKLKDSKEDYLKDIFVELEEMNFCTLKENEVYEFISKENDMLQILADRGGVNEEPAAQESPLLCDSAKCFFANKKLEHIEKQLHLEKTGLDEEIQNLNFELKSLNMSLEELTISQERFHKNITVGGRHPVTKKIILQKVSKYFDDNIRIKMALSNRYKVQIQGDVMERTKILNQIKAQEKRLASLDMIEFQKAHFEHKRSSKQLAKYKEQLGKFKEKFSPLLQSMSEIKKALEKEQSEMERMKNAVSKLEHLKEVMLTEKSRNDQKVAQLRASMRKIKLDPRRHDLPEVIDYAAAKRESAILAKNIKKWQKKVELIQQEKMLHLNELSKKKNI